MYFDSYEDYLFDKIEDEFLKNGDSRKIKSKEEK